MFLSITDQGFVLIRYLKLFGRAFTLLCLIIHYLQADIIPGEHVMTREIIKTFENILSETVLSNRIF